MPEASRTFSAEASSVRAARRFLRGCLAAWSADGYDLSGEQVLSELATNAALHAHSEYTVHLRLDPDCLLVEVSDSSTVLPEQRHYSADATTGRGLNLVSALTDEWGVQASPTGKTVWCRIGPDSDLTVLFDEAWHVSDGRSAQPGGGVGHSPLGDVRAQAA